MESGTITKNPKQEENQMKTRTTKSRPNEKKMKAEKYDQTNLKTKRTRWTRS